MTYLDNNATTKLCPAAAKATTKWLMACSNPSGSSKISVKAAQLIESTKAYVQKQYDAAAYHVLFTSGATESNCLIIRSVVDSWLRRGAMPHVVCSAIEHKSILECLAQLVALKRVEITLVRPDERGQIQAAAVSLALRSNTALVTVMAANNETGVINDIAAIARACKTIPYHTDAVQIFGKTKIMMQSNGIAALSMSFHKLYGPMGIGMLIVAKSLVTTLHLEGQITGSQQDGLRGGTENIPAIAGAAAALIDCFKERAAKNKRLLAMKLLFLKTIERKIPITNVPYRLATEPTEGCTLLVIGTAPKESLPNTLLISVLGQGSICNAKLKAGMEKAGYIVSIGSACNTTSKKASHVLDGAPPVVKRGTLRISFGDLNTLADAKGAAEALLKMIAKIDSYKL